MTGWRWVVLVSGLVGALTACPNVSSPGETVIIWEAQLAPTSTQPDLSGQAALVAQLGGTDVGIGITGGQPGATHPWRVRSGSCTAAGGDVAPQTSYPQLLVSDVGDASAQTRIGHVLSADTAYYAEVLASPPDTGRILCGNFQTR